MRLGFSHMMRLKFSACVAGENNNSNIKFASAKPHLINLFNRQFVEPIAQIYNKPIIALMKANLEKTKSVSTALVVLILVCFLFELPHFEAGFLLPINSDALSIMGANFGPLTISEKEYWRLFTYGFLHSNLLHLLLNAYALFEFGPMAESALGRKTFIFTYLLSSIIGGLSSILFDPLRTSVGASASICGVLGAFIFVSWFKHEQSNTAIQLKRPELILLMVFLGYSLILGFTSNSMDNAAHIGGFISGILAAAILTAKHKKVALAGTFALIAICPAMAIIDAKRMDKNPIVDEFLLRQEGAKFVKQEEFQFAINKFDQALKVIPDEPFALQGRGEAMMKLEQFETAKKDFDTILNKDPKHKGALFNRSIALMHLGRYQEGLCDIDKLVSLDTSHSMVYNNRAWFRLNDFNNKESLDLAMADTQKALELDKSNLAAYDTRGTIYLIQGNYDKAKLDYEKCSKVKETSGAANFHLAILALFKKNQEEADRRLATYRAGDYKPDDFELKFCKEKLGLTGLTR